MVSLGKTIRLLVVLILLLIAVCALIGVAHNIVDCSSKDKKEKRWDHKEKHEVKESSELVFVETQRMVELPNQRYIVTDRFVGAVEEGALIVAVGADGNSFVVKEGVVLADDILITAHDDQFSLVRTNDYRKTVYTE